MKKTPAKTTVGKTDTDIGEIVYRCRLDQDLTQDEFGSKYGVSGPAIFKFEKSYVRPSLELWLSIARDTTLTERRAVVLWLRSKLPEKFQAYLEMPKLGVAESAAKYGKGKGRKAVKIDYSEFEQADAMMETVAQDKSLPKGLRDLLADGELWSCFRPTGHEINLLRDMFGDLGKGSKGSYSEALRLIREFMHSF